MPHSQNGSCNNKTNWYYHCYFLSTNSWVNKSELLLRLGYRAIIGVIYDHSMRVRKAQKSDGVQGLSHEGVFHCVKFVGCQFIHKLLSEPKDFLSHTFVCLGRHF